MNMHPCSVLAILFRPFGFIWRFNLFTMSVPDGGHSRKASYALNSSE